MAPQITTWDDLSFVSEQCDPKTDQFQYTFFTAIDNSDIFYYGRLEIPKDKVTFDQVTHALKRVSDDEIFPRWPASGMELTQAPTTLTGEVHIKRPSLNFYGMLKEYNLQTYQLAETLLAEAQVLEELSKHSHPKIIRYYGCRVMRGHITGLVMDRHPHDLYAYLKGGLGMLDKKSFMNALESSLGPLHARGWAHNDLTPTNILVTRGGMPILIDFGGCQPVGTRLKFIRGTKEWIDGEIKDYTTSDEQHDLSALVKIGAWLDEPVFTE